MASPDRPLIGRSARARRRGGEGGRARLSPAHYMYGCAPAQDPRQNRSERREQQQQQRQQQQQNNPETWDIIHRTPGVRGV